MFQKYVPELPRHTVDGTLCSFIIDSLGLVQDSKLDPGLFQVRLPIVL